MEKERLKPRDVKKKIIRNGTPTEVKRKINWFLLVVREILGIHFHLTIFGYGFIWVNNI